MASPPLRDGYGRPGQPPRTIVAPVAAVKLTLPVSAISAARKISGKFRHSSLAIQHVVYFPGLLRESVIQRASGSANPPP